MTAYRVVTDRIRGPRREYIIKDYGAMIKLCTNTGVFIEDYTSWPQVLIHFALMRARIIQFIEL